MCEHHHVQEGARACVEFAHARGGGVCGCPSPFGENALCPGCCTPARALPRMRTCPARPRFVSSDTPGSRSPHPPLRLLQLNSLHNPENSAHKKQIPYNLQFSTDIHVQHALQSHGPVGHANKETERCRLLCSRCA